MIEVRGLHKSFHELPVQKDIGLEVRDNETLVILGPSGQGKTVFIKTLVRLMEPDSGHIVYDGLDIVALTRKQLLDFRKATTFVFQNSARFDFLNVEDNLCLFPIMHGGLSRTAVVQRASDAMRFVGLGSEVLDSFPAELSGGTRKRIAIARAIIKRPRYIFLDEPTTGLDKTNAGMVSRLIQLLKSKLDVTSIIVTHDFELMKEVADRVALLKDGLIVHTGRKEEISGAMLQPIRQTIDPPAVAFRLPGVAPAIRTGAEQDFKVRESPVVGFRVPAGPLGRRKPSDLRGVRGFGSASALRPGWRLRADRDERGSRDA